MLRAATSTSFFDHSSLRKRVRLHGQERTWRESERLEASACQAIPPGLCCLENDLESELDVERLAGTDAGSITSVNGAADQAK